MAEQHSSRGIMVATIVVAIILVAVVVPFTIMGDKSAAQNNDSDVETRIQPVARFELQKAPAPAAAAGAAKDGVTVFNSVCSACHSTGAAGAPKLGDKAAWGARLAQGKDSLYKNALGGKGAMPPKGGNASLSDAEVKAAVDYLLGKSQ